MKKILILGDCIATGQNCLLEEITGIHPLYIEDDFQRMDQQRQKFVIAWFIKNNKNKINLQSLIYNEILNLAKQEKLRLEKEISWPSLIAAEVTNLSAAGETFQGMHYKLKTYLHNNVYPDLILLTDFDDTHSCVVVNYLNKKYIVKRTTALINEPQDFYPIEVYEKFKKISLNYLTKDKNIFLRKNQKSLYYLKKFIETKKIKYNIVSFQPWLKNIEKEFIDCNNLVKEYKYGNKTNIGKKKELQTIIAKYIYEKIKN